MTALLYRISHVLVIVITLSELVAPAHAQLVEENVLLLWNSGDTTGQSQAIRNAYMLAHPNVIEFDLDIDYAEWPPNSIINEDDNCTGDCHADCPNNHECICCSCPTIAIGTPEHPFKAINQFYITPSMYEDVRQQIVAFLDAYAATQPSEPILAIATTRGLPAAISRSFDATANHSGACLLSSFEGQLAKLGFPMNVELLNPFKNRIGRNFKWLFTPCGGQEYLSGKIFVVSRLDSGDADGDGNYVEDVVALIGRSQNLTVNKFGVTIVYDNNNESALMYEANIRDVPVATYMRNHRWCVYYDNGSAFLHGLNTLATAECVSRHQRKRCCR